MRMETVPEMSEETLALVQACNEYKHSLCIECGMMKIASRADAQAHRETFDHTILEVFDKRWVN